MKTPSLPRPSEQRKIEELLKKLSNVNPISALPAPIAQGMSALRGSSTANPQVFFST
jgi:hypothetical protein